MLIYMQALRELANFRSQRIYVYAYAPATRIPVVSPKQIKIVLLRMQTPSLYIHTHT